MTEAPRLLLVEDDPHIGGMLQRGLGAEGYAVDWARDLKGAIARARAAPPALVVLDRTLPDGDGADFCGALRRFGVTVPVLMLTARDALEDKLRGFEAGADDYLVKPFEFDELLARLSALRRRAPEAAAPLRLEPESRAIAAGARSAALTRREWPLMACLMAHAGRPVSRAELIAQAWSRPGEVTENNVDVYVGYLRRKLSRIGCAARIETVRGVGFMLVP
jgi:two-component system OmpR family response regulator